MADNGDAQSSVVLLFGPQTSISTTDTLRMLRSSLQSEEPHWATTALAGLPASWDAWTARIPMLYAVPGKKLLTDLQRWLTRGFGATEEGGARRFSLPNTLLVPLIVLTQLRQFETYVRLHGKISNDMALSQFASLY
jgi:hypothetical protein